MYICTDCGWTGDEPFNSRNGDPYDPKTEWEELCPLCFLKVIEKEEQDGE